MTKEIIHLRQFDGGCYLGYEHFLSPQCAYEVFWVLARVDNYYTNGDEICKHKTKALQAVMPIEASKSCMSDSLISDYNKLAARSYPLVMHFGFQ